MAFEARWPPEWTLPALLLVVVVAALVLVRVLGWVPFRPTRRVGIYLRARLLAGLVLGAPALLLPLASGRGPAAMGLSVTSVLVLVVFVAVGLAVLIPIGLLGARTARRRGDPVPLTVRLEPAKAAAVIIGGWAGYLLGYELLFRGALLFGLTEVIGGWGAIAVSTALYALAHLDKSPSETLGSLPVGVFLGIGALESGSFWGAFLVHLGIAAAYEVSLQRTVK